MTAEIEQARDDLAFMRSLVSGGEQFQATAGELFMWAGLLYGLQCLGQGIAYFGVVNLSTPGHLILGLGPTVIFLLILARVIWRERKAPKGGPTTRAMTAVFQGAGFANIVMATVFGYGAFKTQDMNLWLYYPVVVCMFQGVAWYVVWAMRKRAWVGLVSLGWFASTLALGALVGNTGAFLVIMGAALFALLMLPGYAMMRVAKTAGA